MGSNFRSVSNGSNRQGHSRQMTNNTNHSFLTVGPESIGGIPGQGPPTLSCSGDGDQSYTSDTSSPEASLPLTNEEGMEVMETQETMGRVGPGPRVLSQYSMRSLDTEDDPHRPMITIQNAHPDAMSVLSDPTMMEFGPPGEEWNDAETPSSNKRQSYLTHRGSRRDLHGSSQVKVAGEAFRYSYVESAAENINSEGTANNNTKELRQGAVDKMVMEALRQAHEARESSVGGDKPAPAASADSGAAPIRYPVKPQLQATSQLVEEMKDLTMRRSSSRGGTSQHGGRKNKGKKHQQPSFFNPSNPRSIQTSFSTRESATRAAVPGSIHSFYSRSGTISYEAGDTFNC